MADSKLPPCPGPKLAMFKDHDARIQWVKRLDITDSTRGMVFEVIIQSKRYALKIFRTFDIWGLGYYWQPLLGNDYNPQLATYLFDPFFKECQAYGRLQEDNMQKLAIQCYGYMFLKEQDNNYLQQQGINLDNYAFNNGDELYYEIPGQGKIRAIVKELAIPKPFNGRSLRIAARRVKMINELGIFIQDVRDNSFINGYCCDFGSSMTLPSPVFDAEAIWSRPIDDLGNFDDMIEYLTKNGLKTRLKVAPNYDYKTKLRNPGFDFEVEDK